MSKSKTHTMNVWVKPSFGSIFRVTHIISNLRSLLAYRTNSCHFRTFLAVFFNTKATHHWCIVSIILKIGLFPNLYLSAHALRIDNFPNSLARIRVSSDKGLIQGRHWRTIKLGHLASCFFNQELPSSDIPPV